MNLINQGTINADVKDRSFIVDNGPTNQGLMEATVGSFEFKPGTLTTNHGTLGAYHGGSVVFDSSATLVNDGMLAVDDVSSMQFGQGLALQHGSIIDIQVGNAGVAGILKVIGNLDLSAGDLTLNISQAPSTASAVAELVATYSGTLNGSFDIVPGNVQIDYSHIGQIFAKVTPEPSCLGIFGLLAACAARRRQRRSPMNAA